MITTDEFLTHFKNPKKEKLIRFATVDPSYTSGRPSLIFDGETVATTKQYAYLASYTPAANDRVIVVSNTVIGGII